MDDFMTTDTTRRDRYGRYLVLPPDATKPVGYTRATTIAKTLDDTSSLMAWGERMTAIGLSRRPDLLAAIDNVADDTKALNQLCQKAKEAGGATVRRDLGTQLHSILERSWTEAGYRPPAAHVDDVKAVHDTLAAHGLRVIPELCETIVVNDKHRIAGTFDLIVEDSTGRLYLADIKTGSSVKYGSLAFAVQLSIYANADAIYGQGAAPDGSDDVREPMPRVRKDKAYIIHVQPSSGQCELHELSLDWGLVNTALMVREMRSANNYLSPITNLSSERDRWIRDRVEQVKALNPDGLRHMWPAHILPPKKQLAPYIAADINTIAAICDQLETAVEAPFPPTDPATVDTEPATSPPDAPKSPSAVPNMDEGHIMPDDALNGVRAKFGALTTEQRAWIGSVVSEARHAGMPIKVSEHPTERRVSLANALIHLAATHDEKAIDSRVRDVVEFVTGDDTAQLPTIPLGALIGALDVEQAGVFETLTAMDAQSVD